MPQRRQPTKWTECHLWRESMWLQSSEIQRSDALSTCTNSTGNRPSNRIQWMWREWPTPLGTYRLLRMGKNRRYQSGRLSSLVAKRSNFPRRLANRDREWVNQSAIGIWGKMSYLPLIMPRIKMNMTTAMLHIADNVLSTVDRRKINTRGPMNLLIFVWVCFGHLNAVENTYLRLRSVWRMGRNQNNRRCWTKRVGLASYWRRHCRTPAYQRMQRSPSPPTPRQSLARAANSSRRQMQRIRPCTNTWK